KDSRLRLLRQARPRVAIDRPPAYASPADPAPRAALDNPLPSTIRPFNDPRPVIAEFAWQALCPQVERKVHDPAMPIRGHHAKPLFHRALPFQRVDRATHFSSKR